MTSYSVIVQGGYMNDKKKRQNERGMTAVKMLLFVLMFINAFIFIYYGLINRKEAFEEEALQYVKDWTVVHEDKDNQTIRATLPQNIENNEYLYFDTRKDVSVYINGELRKDFVEERDVDIPGGSFKKFLFAVPLMESDSGTEIVIERFAVQDIDKDIPEMFISTRSGALSHMLKVSGTSFIISFIILIFSLVAFVVSIVLRLMYKQRIDMLYGALSIFIIATWLITDSSICSLIIGVHHMSGLLNYLACFMMPLALFIYFSALLRGRYKKIMSIVMLVAILNAVVWPVLHFTGLVPFYKVRTPANATLAFLAIVGIAIIIVDAVKGCTSTYRFTCIGFLFFLSGCVMELFFIFITTSAMRQSVPIVFGLGCLLTFIVIQQVHDLRRINMEKQRAIDMSEAKTRFLASMSHEIRTPINSILGMNEMILRENTDKAIDEYSRNIKNSGKMLLSLINDVLDFSKIEAGKLEIVEVDFLMSEMLYDVISLVNERAEEKSLELNVEVTVEVPNEVISDEVRIRQILINFLNNAVKYTEKGTITLKVGGEYTDDGYMLNLSVKDTGKGIRKEDQGNLFEAFSRADIKSNASIEGTGLGLAIVRSIVDSMNGELGVESEFGVGSEFWVKLPVKYNSNELLKSDFMEHKIFQESNNRAVGFTAPDAKILAVDDNQSNLTIVKLFLKKNGIVPDLCSTGNRAASLCKEKKYDLILLDHMMPAPDGIETLHMIREDADSLNKDTRAVVLTANAVAGSRQMYISEGFDDYLTKPLDSGLLEETVKRFLPAEKVLEGAASSQAGGTDAQTDKRDTENAVNINPASGSHGSGSIRDRLSAIEGLDYDTALKYCGGDEELLAEILGDLARECMVRSERMRKSLEARDIKAYEIDAHTIKSSMATVGMKDFSERAKKHEFAAKAGNTDFIYKDAEDFIKKYEEICRKLGGE